MPSKNRDSLLRKMLKWNARTVANGDGKPSRLQHPGGTISLMARSFRCNALLCRLCGCFFIRDLFRKDEKRSPRVAWRSWYTIYSLCCISFLLWAQVGVVSRAIHQARRTRHSFQGSLSVVTHSVLLVKIVFNATSVVAGSSKMLEFYLRAAAFEKRTGIRACSCCSPKRYFWSDVRRYCVLVAYCAAFAAALPLVPESHALSSVGMTNAWTRVSLWIKVLFLVMLYLVYDSVHVVALQSAGEVLVEYLNNQLRVLERCVADHVGGVQVLSHRASNAQCLVEEVRLNFHEIQELKAAVNEVWSWSLVMSSTCTLLVLCTSLYDVCQKGPVNWESYTVFVYSTYITYDFITLASTSQSMAGHVGYVRSVFWVTAVLQVLIVLHDKLLARNKTLFKPALALVSTDTSLFSHCDSERFTMSARINGSSPIVVRSKRVFTMDVATVEGTMYGFRKAEKHERAPYSNMLRSFALQARLCRICGCCFIKDFLAMPPRSPRIVWLHWYTLYAAACFAFYVWYEIDVVTRDAIELSDTHRFFTKSLLVLLHVVIIVKASGNFLTLMLGCRKMLDFFCAAAKFERDVEIPSCKCCAQRHFFWHDIAGFLTFVVYFVSYTVALFHQEQKVDQDGEQWTLREIVDRACSVFAAILFFTYDSVNFIALRRLSEVLVRYVTHLRETMEDYTGDKAVPCELEAAQKVQAMRLHLCTVLELKNSINGVLQISVVVSCVGLLLVTCISLFTVITEGLQRTELWIAIGYSAFNSFEFLMLAKVSQSLCNAMAGSIITYTVILVQTSPDLEATAACGPDAALATTALSI
ncbi:hypothetical protein HPB50_022138 [Hyalomma asiaticum]|uniref:Uncharacterized protein n=1 Tax=Hyalomma asiaticum TaxID=266040 RepID=A0ACB7RR65_HYAAI|nr:hypothetical protein HPB50_022138 [Hyalomma asiaticum]